MSNAKDTRERASEMLGRIVVSQDMTGLLPMQLALAEYRARSQRFPITRRLYPIIPDRPSAQMVAAVVKRGAWVVVCPFLSCQGQEFADPAEPLFMCCSCWNQDAGGRPLRVVFPDNVLEVEAALLERPDARHRCWQPGMGKAELAEDYEQLKVGGTPTSQSTGELITAAIYNARVGDTGDTHQLWEHHDHITDVGAGGGGYLHPDVWLPFSAGTCLPACDLVGWQLRNGVDDHAFVSWLVPTGFDSITSITIYYHPKATGNLHCAALASSVIVPEDADDWVYTNHWSNVAVIAEQMTTLAVTVDNLPEMAAGDIFNFWFRCSIHSAVIVYAIGIKIVWTTA